MKIAEMHEKPRERLVKYGASALSDAELFAIILTAGTRKSNVLEIAQRVSFYLASQRGTPSNYELMQLPGIGKAKSCQVLATVELARRIRENKTQYQVHNIASSSKEIYKNHKNLFSNSFAEEFYVLFLDTKLAVIACEKIFVGTLDCVTVHPREIFHRAIKNLAHSIVIMHNHPSGDCSPSEQDIIITKTMIEVGTIVGIPLVDHIIFGADSFWSWSDSHSISPDWFLKSSNDV